MTLVASPATASLPRGDIWWSNAIFFVGVHIAAGVGMSCRPLWDVPRATMLLAIAVFQAACFGITVGYHRLYSHRAFRATFSLRFVLAALGSMAFQALYRCLRHRLHHRFTDDPIHDPYAATRGLIFSHMGWIFYKPKYERMEQINRDDLENDPVVRFQHKYYVPLALFLGIAMPTLLGLLWNDPSGAFVWGGLVSRLAIWHCTFLVNSLAHWEGLQLYSDENTSRGNFVMAVLTSGEGNHNFHAFPQDFRAGPSPLDWDPSKWIILLLHRFGLATGLRRAREEDIKMREQLEDEGSNTSMVSTESRWMGETWDEKELLNYARARPGRCVLLLDSFAVDVTEYVGEHPGGASVLRKYAVRGPRASSGEEDKSGARQISLQDASSAFHGGMNNHSRAARRRLCELRVARLVTEREKSLGKDV
ncbi:hypothetical protein DFH11DRAFT_1801746 [Phellopilus nigrolimitatus]|nr:hypothetical protein DFH11DRAFT_1801746 [Phellopilus nigrolimitatus]